VNFFVSHTKYFYDFKLARSILDNLCNPPAEEIKAVCDGDLCRGPFVFTYARPASDVTPVPSPFLFMDLSNVHERAFPEIIAAFRAQVKRDDISDREKIDTLRLKLLSIVLTAADFVAPVQKATADIVNVATPADELKETKNKIGCDDANRAGRDPPGDIHGCGIRRGLLAGLSVGPGDSSIAALCAILGLLTALAIASAWKAVTEK
jgi:hypothetical protein